MKIKYVTIIVDDMDKSAEFYTKVLGFEVEEVFDLPGGKIDENETATEALVREIKEELHIDLDRERLQYFCHIAAPAYGEHFVSLLDFIYNIHTVTNNMTKYSVYSV